MFSYTMLQNQCTYLTAECTATACPSLCRRITTSSHTTDQTSGSSIRHYSTELPDYQTVDPYTLLEDDLKYIFRDIRQVSITNVCTRNTYSFKVSALRCAKWNKYGSNYF